MAEQTAFTLTVHKGASTKEVVTEEGPGVIRIRESLISCHPRNLPKSPPGSLPACL